MAERTNFKAYLVYCVMMVAVIYPIYGHWVWSGADMALLSGADSPIVKAIGVASHDFAGSGVVQSGSDGRLATYAFLVLAMGSCQWLLTRTPGEAGATP